MSLVLLPKPQDNSADRRQHASYGTKFYTVVHDPSWPKVSPHHPSLQNLPVQDPVAAPLIPTTPDDANMEDDPTQVFSNWLDGSGHLDNIALVMPNETHNVSDTI